MEADLFGDVAEAKEATEFGVGMKEVKKCRAYDSYNLLAAGISFREQITTLLSTVR